MYHKVGVQKLSPNQIRKLVKGEKIRVKHGNAHQLHLSEEQHKKLMSAHRKGAGTTIQFDPYQQSMHGKKHHGHGEGFKEDYLDKIGNAFSSVWNKPASPQEKKVLKEMLGAQDMIASNIPVLGQVWNPVSKALKNKYGVGVHKRRGPGRPRKVHGHGEGFFSDLGEQILPVVKMLGLGVKKRGRPRKHPVHSVHHAVHHPMHSMHSGHGEGFFEDIGHELLPIVKDIGVSLLKKKAGLGVKRRRAPIGGALLPAGYGVHKTHKRKVGRPKKMHLRM